MNNFLETFFAIRDFINYSGLVKLTRININILTGLLQYFNFNIFWKIIAFVPFIVYFSFSSFLIVVFFFASILSYIPYQIGRLADFILEKTKDFSDSDDDYNYNIFTLVFLPLFVYIACILALMFLIVPKLLASDLGAPSD